MSRLSAAGSLFALVLAATPACAAGDGTADILAGFRLDGVWSAECSQPASADYPRWFYDIPDRGDVVSRVSNNGSGYETLGVISKAVLTDEDTVAFFLAKDATFGATMTLRRVKGHVMTWKMVTSENVTVVDDGVWLEGKQPTARLERCAVPHPVP